MAPNNALHLDSSFDRTTSLADGRRVRLRWIRPADAELLRDGFARLSPESRHMRFFATIKELSGQAVRYLTEVDGTHHAALIAVSVPDPSRSEPEQGLGVARFVRTPADPTAAELAVTVVDDAQRLGLGTLLVETLAAGARERDVATFEMSFLSENTKVRRLLAKLRAERWGHDGDVATCFVDTSLLANKARERWHLAA